MRRPSTATYTATVFALLVGALPASADYFNSTPPPPYNHLNLTPQQATRIESLDWQWRNKYEQLQPQLLRQQHELSTLLSTPKSDPLEITNTQQQINQLKEQLTGFATTNYLEKRRILNTNQQHELEGWMRSMVNQRYPGIAAGGRSMMSRGGMRFGR